MDNYDININHGIATIEVTIQCWNYKGHYRIKVQGNVKGSDILDNAFDTGYTENTDVIWNDCNLDIGQNLDGDMIYTADLKDKNGNELAIDGYMDDLSDYIVGVKIIDYVEEIIA